MGISVKENKEYWADPIHAKATTAYLITLIPGMNGQGATTSSQL